MVILVPNLDALHGIIILGKVINAKVIPATNGVDLGR